MNKILKSFHTNNHGGGEIETTFFREFQRTVRTSRLVSTSAVACHVREDLTYIPCSVACSGISRA